MVCSKIMVFFDRFCRRNGHTLYFVCMFYFVRTLYNHQAPDIDNVLYCFVFREGGSGGVPRSASYSYNLQAPDIDDVKESVKQVCFHLSCRRKVDRYYLQPRKSFITQNKKSIPS